MSSRLSVVNEVRTIALHALYGRAPRSVHHEDTLPGPMPHALTTHAFQSHVCARPHWVAEKSDGDHYVAVHCPRGDFLVDRLLRVFSISPVLDGRDSLAAAQSNVLGRAVTVIDGELVRLPKGDPCSGEYRFIGFDAICHEGVSLLQEPYSRRYMALGQAIQSFPKGTYRKKFVNLRSMPWLLQRIEQRGKKYFRVERDGDGMVTRAVPNDGLVFVSEYGGYNTTIYKWKPRSHNTVDFSLHLSLRRAGDVELQVTVDGGTRETVRIIKDTERVWKEFNEGDIVECSYCEQKGSWVPVRLRKDKSRPNFVTVFVATMEVLAENLTLPRMVRMSQAAAITST